MVRLLHLACVDIDVVIASLVTRWACRDHQAFCEASEEYSSHQYSTTSQKQNEHFAGETMGLCRCTAVLLVGCSALALSQLAAAACPASYNKDSTPFLMGGTYSACTSGCQPRDNIWSKICKLAPDEYLTWGVCESWQRPHSAQLAAQTLDFPGLTDLSPCQLYEAIGNRTLWVIGDSHVKSLWYVIRCFMVDFWDHAAGECAASSDTALQTQLELTSLQGHSYNTPPRCLHMIGSRGRICLVHSPIGDYYVSDNPQVPGTLQLLIQNFTSPQDIVYIAIGRWHANNCEGIHPSYMTSLESIGTFVQGNRQLLPNMFFGTAPHDHSKCVNKTMVFDVPQCLPAEQGGYHIPTCLLLPALAHEIMGDKYKIHVVDFYNTSMALFDGHITAAQSIGGVIDCLHFCRPGLGEINLWMIYSTITSVGLSQKDPSPPAAGDGDGLGPYTCVPVAPVLPRPYGASAKSDGSGSSAVGHDTAAIQHAVARDAWGYPIPENR